jgi:hypothetical protein
MNFHLICVRERQRRTAVINQLREFLLERGIASKTPTTGSARACEPCSIRPRAPTLPLAPVAAITKMRRTAHANYAHAWVIQVDLRNPEREKDHVFS